MNLIFHILGIMIPTDEHIFQRGRYTTNQIQSLCCASVWLKSHYFDLLVSVFCHMLKVNVSLPSGHTEDLSISQSSKVWGLDDSIA